MNSETEKKQVCTISNPQSRSETSKSKINVKILKHCCKLTTACGACKFNFYSWNDLNQYRWLKRSTRKCRGAERKWNTFLLSWKLWEILAIRALGHSGSSCRTWLLFWKCSSMWCFTLAELLLFPAFAITPFTNVNSSTLCTHSAVFRLLQ